MRLVLVTLNHQTDGWFKFTLPLDEHNRVVQGHRCEGSGADNDGWRGSCTLLPMEPDGKSSVTFGEGYKDWRTDLRSLTIGREVRATFWDHNGNELFFVIGAVTQRS
jgi:hypothetical protein